MQVNSSQPIADAWVEIDLDRMRNNLATIFRRLPEGSRYCAVLKADAYGHGIDRVAPVLADEGVDFAAITDNADVFALRRAGFAGRIMRLRGAAPEEARQVCGLGVEELVTGATAARALADPADPRPVHLPINAGGMGRDGLELSTEYGRAEAREILTLPGLQVVGLATHFPINSEDELAAGRARFEADVAWCLHMGKLSRDALLVHAASSLGLMAAAEIKFDMVRDGAALWGIVGPRSEFGNVMSLRARITSINRLPEGATVGYDRVARLTRETRVANVSIGYANGVRRTMANRAQVAVRGQIVPLIGKISMNALTLDVTDIPDAQAGDTVTLFGTDGAARITRAMTEAATGTIMADLYCDWGRSNRRVYPYDQGPKT
ncbi:Alanine racemase [Jannaschia seosinensis]|uniref:alanine racemase n=1 Tax=Jannaschia seosinensis TaxID=313367 RepID=A0A0M7BBH4_9RHOB|nr:alanine racemase [Jannaschia seosinensis]CUH40080.1 Alanine racemase [Jannaschia seosinensis]